MIDFVRRNMPLSIAFLTSLLLMVWGGVHERETPEIISLILTLSVSMAGFGLVAFQITRLSSEAKNDFLESSIIMVLSTIVGFFYLVFPDASLLGINFGEVAIFMFFWAFILFLIFLINRRFGLLR